MYVLPFKFIGTPKALINLPVDLIHFQKKYFYNFSWMFLFFGDCRWKGDVRSNAGQNFALLANPIDPNAESSKMCSLFT